MRKVAARSQLKREGRLCSQDPLPFWLRHDAPGRRGITEAHYVAGKYAYLDALVTRHPNLTIGGCAGGGREIDIEAMRRAQVNSRADGMCANE